MTLFEISIIIMAAATVAQAISTVAKNYATMKKLNEAKAIVKDLQGRLSLGAEVGALVGSAIYGMVKPEAERHKRAAEATMNAQRAIVDDLARALEQARAERDDAIKRGPGAVDVLIHNARASLSKIFRKG